MPSHNVIALLTELLNSVFDIYADGRFDYDRPSFVELDFLRRLEKVQNMVSSKVKGSSRGIDRERAEEALLNLGAFIQYKREE